MSTISREKTTVHQMIALYCQAHHLCSEKCLCPDCQALANYAMQRLDHCKFGNNKPSCKRCPIHCYKPQMREQMQIVMRYAGPRMLWHHPLATLRHCLK